MLRDEICSMTNYMVEQNIWWDEFFGGTSRAEGYYFVPEKWDI